MTEKKNDPPSVASISRRLGEHFGMTDRPAEGVTGRDDYIIRKALAYAITTIRGLPEHRQEWSDLQDMVGLFRVYCGCNAQQQARFLETAERHMSEELWRQPPGAGA
jgi:hypothetical protein